MKITMLTRLKKYQFLFEELVKRDFKQKYKRTVLGMGWSLLSPLLQLLVMSFIFGQVFGRDMEHFTIYLFCGNLTYSYFKESTSSGMSSLMSNAKIFTKINVPKYMFLLSKNVSSLINYGLTLCIFFLFVFIEGIDFGLHFFALLYPICCLVVFNLGMGLILSAMYVFFRDVKYLYDIFTLVLMYFSAIFYTTDNLSPLLQTVLMCNPIYCYIKYFRLVVLNGTIPSLHYHLLCAFYAVVVFVVGAFIYKKYNHKFLYYV